MVTAEKSGIPFEVVAWTAKQRDGDFEGTKSIKAAGSGGWCLTSCSWERRREKTSWCICALPTTLAGHPSLTAASLEMLVPSRDRCHYPRNYKAQSHVLLLFSFLSFCLLLRKRKLSFFVLVGGLVSPVRFLSLLCLPRRKDFFFFFSLITCASILVWACFVLLQKYMDTPRPGFSPGLSTCPLFFENLFSFFSFWLILLSFCFSSVVHFIWREHCTSKALSPPLSAALTSRKRLRQE